MASITEALPNRLWLILILIFSAIFVTILISEPSNYSIFISIPISKIATIDRLYKNKNKYCYQENNSSILFLHVTNKSREWNPIEVCAFKTAALLNNETGVCVLTKSEMKPHPDLVSLVNLEFALMNLSLAFEDTPLEEWYRDYLLNDSLASPILAWELSDGLRLAYLYKYGGKYMDTDSWTLRNLAHLRNVAAWHYTVIANGVMFFEKGHPFVKASMEAFPKYFKIGVWGAVGPDLITTVHRSGVVPNSTYTLLDSKYFFPFLWRDYPVPFNPNQTEYVKSKIKGSYTMHMYRANIEGHLGDFSRNPPNGSFVDGFYRHNCSAEHW